MAHGIIYKATNLINGKVYIGKTTMPFAQRKSKHKYNAFKEDGDAYEYHFYRAIRKYGWDNFKWEIIDEADTKEELNEKEVFWIEYYDSYYNGYNMTKGGDGTVGVDRLIGEDNPTAKLTEKDVIEIKKLLIEGNKTKTEIADMFNVTLSCIMCISKNKSWKHVYVDGWDEYLANQKGSLTEDDVIMIKKMLLEGKQLSEIADMFDVSSATIANISSNKTWKHVTFDEWDKRERARKLTEDEVMEIKKMLINNVPRKDIIQRFDINKQTLSRIERNKCHSHVHVDGWDEYLNKRNGIKRNKLTDDDVVQIKKLLIQGVSQEEIAKKFNVKRATIGNISRNANWKHVIVEGWDEYLNQDHTDIKLTVEDVIEIKKMLIKGVNHEEIANKFNISKSTVSAISTNRNWSSVKVDGWEEYIKNKNNK